MPKLPTCPHCHVPLRHIGREKIQLGQTGWILGDLPNLVAGSLPVSILCCPECNKLEFYLTDSTDDPADKLPQRTCPSCGLQHDFDYPKCPHCKYDYNARR